MPVNTISPVLGHRITFKLIAHPNRNALQSCRIGCHGQDHALPMHYNMYGIARACLFFQSRQFSSVPKAASEQERTTSAPSLEEELAFGCWVPGAATLVHFAPYNL
jgi:hypothetical protein